jgi:predicted RNA-binding protein
VNDCFGELRNIVSFSCSYTVRRASRARTVHLRRKTQELARLLRLQGIGRQKRLLAYVTGSEDATCQLNAYLVRSDREQLVLEDVTLVEVEGNQIFLTTLFESHEASEKLGE